MNTLIQDRNELLPKAGSFWTSTIDRAQRDLVRSLVDMAAASTVQDLVHAGNRLTAQQSSQTTFVTLKIEPKRIVLFSPDMQQRVLTRFAGGYVIRPKEQIVSESYADHGLLLVDGVAGMLGSESGDLLAFPLPGFSVGLKGDDQTNSVLRPRWLMPVPADIEPIRFLSLKGELVCGCDFVCTPGLVHFFEDPTHLFKLPYVTVACAEVRPSTLLGYTLKTDVKGPDMRPVARYFREAQTAATFQAAIACAAGLVVLPADSILELVLPLPVGYRYVFKDYVLEARYPHTALTAGNAYLKDHVVGDHVRVTGGGHSRPQWYRDLDWSAGLSLDSFSPFKGLTAADGQRRAYTTDQITDGKYHVRIQLDGDPAVQEKFWTRVAAAELNTGRYLCDVLGIVGEGETQVNPVDVFFESGLVRNALVVDLIAMPDVEFTSRAVTFIDNEKPVGASVITRVFT